MTEVKNAIDAGQATLQSEAASTTDGINDIIWSHYQVGCQGSGNSWYKAHRDVDPPGGWRRASVAVTAANLRFRDGDENLRQVGFQTWLTLQSNGKIRIHVAGIVRDNDAKEVGQVTLNVVVTYVT